MPGKRFHRSAVCALFCLAASWAAPDLSDRFFNDTDKVVVFFGDSITQAGGYITDLQALVKKRYPGLKAKFINEGKSSETVAGLTEPDHPGPRPLIFDRLGAVLQSRKPNLVFACYGMNDGIYHPFAESRFKPYRDGIAKLVATVRASGAEIILLTPPAFDSLQAAKNKILYDAPPYGYKTPYRNYDSVLSAYGNWLMSQRSQDQMVIDIHAPMLAWAKAQRKTNANFTWTSDGIHPNPAGHQVMAEALDAALFASATRLGGGWKKVPGWSATGDAEYRADGRLIPENHGRHQGLESSAGKATLRGQAL